jgi:flagellar hook-associated protein FlgK
VPIRIEKAVAWEPETVVSILGTALSALNAFGRKLGVSAHNIANVNTEGFKKRRVILEEAEPSGVTATITRVDTSGFPILSSEGPGNKMEESSNVSLDEEIVNLKTAQHGYQANWKTVKAAEETLGSLFDSLG